MEKAILCRDPGKHHIEDFERVYLGNEFCQNLIFTIKELQKKIFLVHNKSKSFSIVTPYVTDDGLERLKKIFDFLSKEHPGTEVIVNDLGVLDLIKEYNGLIPVLGRVIGNHLTKGPPDLRANSKESLSFFKAKGIERCEVSNKGHYENIQTEKDMHYSLYYPYMFLATGRRCMVGFRNMKAKENFDPSKCRRACDREYFLIKHKQIDDKIIVYGNTHFIKKDNLPKLNNIDRLVYMPDTFFN